jgi:hypothetical protein
MSQLPEPGAAPDPALAGSATPASPTPPPIPAVAPVAPGGAVTPTPVQGEPTPARLITGIVLGAAVAGLGGWILGEYPFTGFTPYIAGVLFALVVTEVMLSISHRRDGVIAIAGALCTLAGLGLAVRISTGEGIDPIPIGGWVALGVGAVVALLRGGLTAWVGRRARSTPPPS